MVKWLSGYKTTKVFLFLTILLAPLYMVRFRVGPYPSTLLEVLVGLTVAVWVVEKVRKEGIKGLKRIKGINVPMVLFLAAAAVSVVVSPDKRGALGIFKAYFVEPILICLVIKDAIKSREDWWLVFGALGLSGVWVALLAVFQMITGQFTFALHEAALGRAHAVYNTANAVGLYIGPIIMLCLGPAPRWVRGKGLGRVGIIGEIGLMLGAILLSKSAGAVVGLGVSLGILAVLRFLGVKKGIRVIEVIGGIGLIAGAWFFLNISDFAPKSVDPFMRGSTDTLQFRLCLWEGTRNLLWEHPVFGAGLSGFKELYSQKYFTCDSEPLEYPHNWVLNFWAEAGLLGLAAFLWVLWKYFKSVRVLRCQGVKEGKTSAYCLLPAAFLAAMLYWLVHGLADVPYFKNDLALEFWVIVGLAETLGLVL